MSKRDDPFYEEPLHKAFYYPSQLRELDERTCQTVLSPGRMHAEKNSRLLTRREEKFLMKTNTYANQMPDDGHSPRDNSSKFDESWPDSERPSTMSIPSLDDTSPSSDILAKHRASRSKTSQPSVLDSLKMQLNFDHYLHADGNSQVKQDRQDSQQNINGTDSKSGISTLSKYIERFRHGVPLSREERMKQPKTNPQDFWWLSSPPTPNSSSTPKSDTGSGGKTKSRRPLSPARLKNIHDDQLKKPHSTELLQSSNGEVCKDKRTMDFVDDQTRHLQEKTDRLLEQSESSLHSSEPAVSTQGLGSTPSFSSVDEQPYRPAFINRDSAKDSFTFDHVSYLGPSGPLRPENDILHQWRLRRRLEVMRETAQHGEVYFQSRTPTVLTEKIDVDSKLREFRERLAQSSHADSGQEPKQLKQLDMAEERGIQSTNTSGAKEVKSVEIQTEAKNDSFVQTEDPSSQHPCRKVDYGTSKSPIASPSLKRKVNHHDTNLEPHLHLMCDILPCPHDHSRDDCENQKCGGKQSSSKRDNYSDPESSQESCESDFEQYKRQHFKKLQREMADRELTQKQNKKMYSDQAPAQDCGRLSYYECQQEVPERDNAKVPEVQVDNMTDSCDHERQTSTQGIKFQYKRNRNEIKSDLSCKGKAKKKEYSRKTTTHRDYSTESLAQGQTSKDIPSSVRNQVEYDSCNEVVRNDIKYGADKSVEKKMSTQKHDKLKRGKGKVDTENLAPQSASKVLEDSSFRKKSSRKRHVPPMVDDNDQLSDVHRDGFPRPRITSSPKPSKSTLNSAIDKVVKNHLFPPSSASLQSSTDTLATEYHQGPLEEDYTFLSEQDIQNKQEGEATVLSEQDIQEKVDINEILAVSDGEEFADDDMLIELRARRAKYLSRIAQIDQLLQEN